MEPWTSPGFSFPLLASESDHSAKGFPRMEQRKDSKIRRFEPVVGISFRSPVAHSRIAPLKKVRFDDRSRTA